ncbi:DUF6292 family protein [Amycolatopsis sp. NPDC059090]|uniref:DUF6292 family protein n=1 Tax=unclassified Amycolatopsis TaxID=2618356 RepID=UPI003672D0D0
MTATPHVPPSNPHAVVAALRGYLAEVTRALGVGLESRTVDQGPPLSAYVALGDYLPGYPGRDAALLWDEVRGWSAAVETHSGEDLIVIRYLGGSCVAPPPSQLIRFVTALREDDHRIGQLAPPALRSVGSSAELKTLLRLRETT